MKSVKAFSLFAIIAAVSAVSFGIFESNSSGNAAEIFNIGSTSVEALGLLFIPVGILMLYNQFR